MRILVVGSGGREHSLCWAIAASPLCDALYCAPGNAGIAAEAECVAIAADDIDALVAFCREMIVDLTWLEEKRDWVNQEASKWRLLWKIESNMTVRLIILDAGTFEIFVHDDDLAKPEFSRVFIDVTSS